VKCVRGRSAFKSAKMAWTIGGYGVGEAGPSG
jgi:hypothetical protein